MGFFAEVSLWLHTLLATYVSNTTATVAAALMPAVTILAVVYVMGWGFLQLSGQIEEPLLEGLKRIARLALVLGVGLNLWLYHALVADTLLNAPAQLAAHIIGAHDAVTIVDSIIYTGGDTASALIEKGGILDGNFAYYLAGFFVYLAVGIAAIYTIFLLSLSQVALSVLLALGPLFIAMLLFQATRRLFDTWLAQCVNYALVTVLATLVVQLLMHLLTTAATQAAAQGTGITIAEGVRVCFAAALIFLVLRQVLPMASGVSGGLALSSHRAVSTAAHWTLQRMALASHAIP
jgi:type IV secretion system protein VirB6